MRLCRNNDGEPREVITAVIYVFKLQSLLILVAISAALVWLFRNPVSISFSDIEVAIALSLLTLTMVICLAPMSALTKAEGVRGSRKATGQSNRFIICFFGLYIGALLIFLARVFYISPIQAWDVLTWWGPSIIELWERALWPDESSAGGLLLARHPRLAQFLVIAGDFCDVPRAFALCKPHLLWFACYATFLGVVALACFYIANSVSISIVATCLMATVPLLENHVLGFGYAEIWQVCFLVSILSLKVFSDSLSTLAKVLLTITLSSALALTKNNGIFYVVLLALAQLGSQFFDVRMSRRWLSSLLIGGFVLGLASYVSVDMDLAYKTGLSMRAQNIYWWGNALNIDGIGLVGGLESLYWALFVNNSFGALAIIVLIMLASSCGYCREGGGDMARFTMILSLLCLLVFISLTAYTEYFATYGRPGQDTSLSRALMPISIAVAFATLCHVLKMSSHGTRPQVFR